MNSITFKTLGLSAFLLLATAEVSSHGQAKGIVLDRHNLMTDIKDAGKVVKNMVRGKSTLDRTALKASADLIVTKADAMLPMFPDTKASRRGKGSNAKQEIWSQFDRFSEWNDKMAKHAAELSAMAESATLKELKAQHQLIGKTCSGCHKAFRAKKKH